MGCSGAAGLRPAACPENEMRRHNSPHGCVPWRRAKGVLLGPQISCKHCFVALSAAWPVGSLSAALGWAVAVTPCAQVASFDPRLLIVSNRLILRMLCCAPGGVAVAVQRFVLACGHERSCRAFSSGGIMLRNRDWSHPHLFGLWQRRLCALACGYDGIWVSLLRRSFPSILITHCGSYDRLPLVACGVSETPLQRMLASRRALRVLLTLTEWMSIPRLDLLSLCQLSLG